MPARRTSRWSPRNTGNMVSQGLDVLSNRATMLAYAASYVELLKDLAARVERETGADQLKSIVALRTALAVDTVRLVVEDYRGQIREAALVAPTHPLRALWHLAWSLLGAAWVRETNGQARSTSGRCAKLCCTGSRRSTFRRCCR